MWLTNSDLPTEIEIDKNKYAISTDFRSWIIFESIMVDPAVHERFKPYFMIDAVLKEPFEAAQQEQILTALFSFYRMQKPVKQVQNPTQAIGYRFAYDMDLILAAFRQQYQINLLTVDLHWWEFKSLFDGLSKDTKFIQVVGYRTMDIAKLDKHQKKHYQELKQFYALPAEPAFGERTQEEIETELLKKLGGDGYHK